jgi:hypothetical protein
MSETDPKGFYTCLGLEPGATADEIRSAYHRCAKRCHPDVDSRPEAKARFLAVNEAYRTLSNPKERATYDNSLGRAAKRKAYKAPVWIRTELDNRTSANTRVIQLLGLGALALASALLFVSGLLRGPDTSLSRLSTASSTLETQPSPPWELPSVPVHSVDLSAPSSPVVSAPPTPAPNATSLPSGAWLLRDLPSSKPALRLMSRDETVQVQRQLIERGYLLGPEDGVWGPRSHAALEEFRRAQGVVTERGAAPSHNVEAARSEAARDELPPTAPAAIRDPEPPRISDAAKGELVPPLAPVSNPRDPPRVAEVAPAELLQTPSPITNAEPAPIAHASRAELAPKKPPADPRKARREDATPNTPPARENANANVETLSGTSRQLGPAETYVGAWARSPAACYQSQTPPLEVWANRAESFGGLAGGCDFAQVRREELGWRTRARCNADGRSWTANVHLKVSGSTLIWSSERGRATYYRCR